MAKPEDGGDVRRLVALMRARSPLFGLIYEFNLLPCRYMHESWAEALFTPDLWQRLRRSRRAEHALSRLVLDDLGVTGSFPAAVYDEPRARLALLSPETVERVSLHLGIVLDGAGLRRVIDREGVTHLRAALGEDTYSFAVQRSPLLATAGPADEGRGDGVEAATLPERLVAGGRSILARAMAGLPTEVLKRFRLKLPREAALDFTLSDGSAAAAALAVRVIRETEPRWASLFAAQAA